ncbi:glucosyltransferase domain-containing protein [Enterobacter asburiae]|uniref:glucosyltransferase domain-containing protein n=1 Tax=Enterobacter asburiae TaxID=61645 RepID=UPI003B249ECF
MFNIIDKNISTNRAFGIFLGLLSFAYVPFIFDRIYFIDDITRSIKGYFGWIGLGRPLTELIAIVLTINTKTLADITPLPQLLSIAALLAASMLLVRNISDRVTLGTILISLTAVINPLVFSNMLYRFDSLSMSLSILFPIIAWDIYLKGNRLFTFLLLVATLSLYQPAISIFPILIVLSFMRSKEKNRQKITLVLHSAIITALSCVVYYFTIIKTTMDKGEQRGDISISNGGIVHKFSEAFTNSSHVVFDSYGNLSTLCICLLSLFFLVNVALKVKRQIISKDEHRYIIATALLLTPILLIILSVGVNLILSNSYFPPRVLFPISLIIFTFLASSYGDNKATNTIASVIAVILIYSSISVIYVTSSALVHQKNYDQFILNSVTESLNKMDTNKNVFIYGETDDAVAVKIAKREFSILKHVKNNFYDMTFSQSLVNYGVANVKFSGDARKTSLELKDQTCKKFMETEVSQPQYSIFTNEKDILVYLGRVNCK